MMSRKWTNFYILDFTLFVQLLTVVRSQLNNFGGSLNTGNPGPLLNFPGYVPTVGPSFPAISPAFPVQFPVYIFKDHEEIPSKRFGFNVIYRSPNDPIEQQPNYYSETKRNASYSLPESHNDNKKPANRYNDKHSYETKGVNYRTKESKNPLLTLYDDWSPDDYERSRKKENEKIPPPRHNHDREAVPVYNERKSYPRYIPQGRHLKSSGNHRLQAQYRSYPSKGKSHSSQQFHRTNSYPRRIYGKPQNREITRNHPQRKVSTRISKKTFRPSPPDVYLNSQSQYSDYSTEGTSNQPRFFKIKNMNFTDKLKKQSCIKTNKTVDAINNDRSKIRFCYACIDSETGTRYEECSLDEAPNVETFNDKSNSKLRNKREIEKKSRDKRQHDYYHGSDHHGYTPNDGNYRFGPEAFADDEPSNDRDEVSYESDDPNERCWKRKSGDMLCISCENTYSGGTYEQCSYATDPQKVTYDRSVSTEYGTSKSLEDDNKSYYPDTESDQPLELTPSSPPLNLPPFVPHSEREPNLYYTPQSSYPPAPIPPPIQVSSHERQDYRPSAQLPFIPRPPNYNVPTFPSFGDHFVPYGISTLNNYGKPYNSFDETFSNIFPEVSNNPNPLHEFDSDEDEDFSVSLEEEENERKFSRRNIPKVRRNPSPVPLNKRNDKIEMKSTIDEFAHKNRTACKKVFKNKMTCYQCLDDKGMKHEDCLYVRPSKTNKISYHKMSEYKSAPNNAKSVPQRVPNMPSVRFGNIGGHNNPPQTTKGNNTITFRGNMYNPTNIHAGLRRSRSSDNKDNVAISNVNVTTINRTEIPDQLGKESLINFKTSNNETNEDGSSEDNEEDEEEEDEEDEEDEEETTTTSEKYNAIPTDPPELEEQIPNPDGQFSEDTLMMFDPLLGISLPKYMLEKSEHEAIFDEILASG